MTTSIDNSKGYVGSYRLNPQKCDDFARLSGDYNPLHVDAVYARRLQFGHQVVHGIYHMLCAFDHCLELMPAIGPLSLTELKANFHAPVSRNMNICLSAQVSDDLGGIKITTQSGTKRLLTLGLSLKQLPTTINEPIGIGIEVPAVKKPLLQDLPPSDPQGACELSLDEQLYADLFPNLHKNCSKLEIAEIIATTRIVGMKCPGLHSLYSEIDVKFSPVESAALDKPKLSYSVNRIDERFGLIKLAVLGLSMKGVLTTFFRPKPADQLPFSDIKGQIPLSCFNNQCALVIGGTRGIGETTAKILAAGGADVVITYHRGKQEADRICTEIVESGGNCRSIQLDVCNPKIDMLTAEFADSNFSHIYYFASPHIDLNNTKQWDRELFALFCQYYVEAFSEIVRICVAGKSHEKSGVTFFFPSTVYLDEYEKGFTEYTVAKAAGEALCTQLASSTAGLTFLTPRLPRMATDQTLAVIPIKSASTFDIMRSQLVSNSETELK